MQLTQAEYQKLVLMVGSKKDLGTYLGLDTKTTDQLWREMGLMAPLTWLREQSREAQLEMLAKAGSLKVLAKKLSCSEAALRPIYIGEPTRELNWELDYLLEQFEKYKSVRFVAYMHEVNESLVRKEIDRYELDLGDIIDYSFGDNSNSKGRRAEMEYAKLRGEAVTEDKNKTAGSQAEYDFDDIDLGRVNVKSSRQYKYRARTRKENPLFWKFSSSGWATADKLVCMCYDEKMQTLLGVYIIDAERAKHSKTLTITAREMKDPDVLRSSPITE